MESPSLKLESLRKKSGMSLRELARQAGLSLAIVRDYADSDDMTRDAAVGHVVRLANVLHVTPVNFFSDTLFQDQPITFEELSDELKIYLDENHLSEEAFGENFGWTIESFLANPSEGYNWSISCLYDVCNTLGINWLRALPSALS